MALDDDNNQDQTPDENADTGTTPLTNVNPNAPDFVKDIKAKSSSRLDNIPLDMTVGYKPQNPYEMDGNSISYHSNTDAQGLKPESSSGIAAEAYEFMPTAQLFHSIFYNLEDREAQDDLEMGIDSAPPGWNPKTDQQNFVNVRPENLPYVLGASGPRSQAIRLQRVYEDQAQADAVANGSFTGKLLGGGIGLIADPSTYIPILPAIKYAKIADSFIKGAMRALPGVAAYSVAQAGAENIDKVSGNLQDFVTDAFTDTIFGTALFGVGGAIGTGIEKMGLWNLRKAASSNIDGIDYNLVTDAAGQVTGYKAVDMTGTLSAAKVSFAQELADSQFSKSGIFKIPYLGAAVGEAIKLKIPGTNFYFGSPLIALLQSKYKTLVGFVDRTQDHSIITQNLEKGGISPPKFDSYMQQSTAGVRAIAAQLDGLHVERNGFDISSRPLGGLVNLGLNLKDKALNILSKDMDKSEYVSKEDFFSEIENTLVNNQKSEHSSVNEAANIVRTHLDEVYKNYRTAYKLPEDWLPPKTAQGYLMRVYDTPYMNANKDLWVSSISKWLESADNTITDRMQPINDLSDSIKEFEGKHTEAVNILANLDRTLPLNKENIAVSENREIRPGTPEHTLKNMRIKLRSMKDTLQNELRTNPDLQLHVDDWNALSADEGKALKDLLQPSKDLEAQVEQQKDILRETKAKASQKLSAAKNESNIKKAIPKSKKYVESKNEVAPQEEKLRQAQNKLDKEKDRLQEMAHKGEINPRFYVRSKDSLHYEFKDPNDRLKFRDTYESHAERETHAKAYYDTIMNQMPEDTINQVMGRFTGNQRENPIKQRTLLIPDKVLYDNGFMSKDLMSKISNYTRYLDRRTNLKRVFNDVTVDGGIESLINNLHEEYQNFRSPLDARKTELQTKGADSSQIKDVDRQLAKEAKEFDNAKNTMNHMYEKMMGIKRYSRGAEQARSLIMSMTSIASLPFVPFILINHLAASALQHGMWPLIRDGIYPIVNSLGNILKTKDSEAWRKTAPSVHLALQDVLNGYMDRNWGTYSNPYLNLGRIVKSAEQLAHLNSNFTLTNYIENGIQHITAATAQSEIMRILHEFKNGTISKKDSLYLRKYGIDANKWADRMINAFNKDGGGKTALGGYQSLFHQWEDLEAANHFSDGVFRAVKDTNIHSGLADSPFWSDTPLGSIIRGYTGWTYASVNRYVIPNLQKPDAQKLIGALFMLGTGALVSPMRRFARGEDPFPDNMTDEEYMWSAINDSGVFSYFATTLADANLLSGDRLIGNLKNDRYKDRTRAGLLGPAWGDFNRLADVIGMMTSREWNKADTNKAVRMIPFLNASETYWKSKQLVDSLNIPQNREQAHKLKEINQ